MMDVIILVLSCRRNWAKSGLAACLFLCISALVPHTLAALERITVTNERILVDPATGLALGGYDPVAYYVDQKARLGKDGHELYWNGAVWRFVNIGNLEAFKDAPDVYAPQFGGYGALSVSRGYPAHGSPLVWAIHEQQLFFFASPVNRAAWLQHPSRLSKAGHERWPAIEKTLAR